MMARSAEERVAKASFVDTPSVFALEPTFGPAGTRTARLTNHLKGVQRSGVDRDRHNVTIYPSPAGRRGRRP